jgi:hypothetical protein
MLHDKKVITIKELVVVISMHPDAAALQGSQFMLPVPNMTQIMLA